MERACMLRSYRSHGEKPLDRKDIKFKSNWIIQCFLISIVLGQIRSLSQSDITQTRLSFLCSTNQEPERVIFSSLNQSKAGILSPKPTKNRTRLRFSHNQLKVLCLRFLILFSNQIVSLKLYILLFLGLSFQGHNKRALSFPESTNNNRII